MQALHSSSQEKAITDATELFVIELLTLQSDAQSAEFSRLYK